MLLLLTAYLGVVMVGVAVPLTLGERYEFESSDGFTASSTIPVLTASNGRLTFLLLREDEETMGVVYGGDNQVLLASDRRQWTVFVTDRGPWIDPPHPSDRFRGMLLSHVRFADGRSTSIGLVPHCLLLTAVTWCWVARWRRYRDHQRRGFPVDQTTQKHDA
jgi:hypothetical protein